MRQIYYTQCPIGYGLGASNGFQIKRLSKDYPLTGDFRHLGLRAFLAGTRTLAPPALRYRSGEGGMAEVAWLTPRPNEYETERGLWGRPGGHFAHGVQLDESELDALARWPAGLYGQPCWTRTDREPSRGRDPEPLALSAADLRLRPEFDVVAPLASGLERGLLERLLAALAHAVRDDRTLFLIGEADRLADLIAVLTFAFPEPWRGALTFSTYHDRPEELPGYRLQGTIAAARPNRAALLALGRVADLAAGTVEPPVETPDWARTLAGWLVARDDPARDAWTATRRRALRARPPEPPGSIWSDDWLDRVFGLAGWLDDVETAPHSWADLAGMAAWIGRARLGDEWVAARPPSWWLKAVVAGGPDARRALLAHLSIADAWRGAGVAAAWGVVVAAQGAGDSEDWPRTLSPLLRVNPPGSRPAFVRALIRALPGPAGQGVIAWLEGQPSFDRAFLLTIKLPGAIERTLSGREPGALATLLAEALALRSARKPVLEALAAEGSERPATREGLAKTLAGALDTSDEGLLADVLDWVLRQEDASQQWLSPFLRSLFADPHELEAWRRLKAHTTGPLMPALARVVLRVADDPTMPDEPFRWGVEEVLLALPDADRPHDPRWPGTYLDRMPSGLELLRRLHGREFKPLGVRRWLDGARERGELTPAQAGRIDDSAAFARVLRSGECRSLLDVKLPAVLPEERGTLLTQILARLGSDERSLGLALDTGRVAWPGGFAPGAPGLDGLARALAEPMRDPARDPARWFDRLRWLLDRLRLLAPEGGGFEPDGLAALLAAETTGRLAGDRDGWRLRQFLFDHGTAWRLLAEEIRRALASASRSEARAVLESWDRDLAKGLHTARFYELWLNTADGAALAAAVAARASALRTLRPLSWWPLTRRGDAPDDIRDRVARRVPMAPFPDWALAAIQHWMRPDRAAEADPFAPIAVNDDPVETTSSDPTAGFLSPRGLARWRCLVALSAFARAGLGAGGRWQTIVGWEKSLPLAAIDPMDRARFVAWLIFHLDESESFQIARLAKWLDDCGATDEARVRDWPALLSGLVEVDQDAVIARAPLVGELGRELTILSLERGESPRKSRGSDSH